MTEANLLTAAIILGAGGFVYLYYQFPRRFDRSDRRRLPRLTWYTGVDYYLKITTLIIPLLALQAPQPWMLIVHQSSPLRWIGLAIAAAGAGLLAWAMGTLADQFSPCDFARVPSRLVETGPYRWIRHPIYASNLVLLAGLAILSGSLWLVFNWLLLLTCYTIIAKGEEATLHQEVVGYEDYASVRGRFLPRRRRRNTNSR